MVAGAAELKSPSIPLFSKGGLLSKSFRPLIEKEGKGRFYSANFWATSLAGY
jgi:hypothetical protein